VITAVQCSVDGCSTCFHATSQPEVLAHIRGRLLMAHTFMPMFGVAGRFITLIIFWGCGAWHRNGKLGQSVVQ
jgi:hypothetical protein